MRNGFALLQISIVLFVACDGEEVTSPVIPSDEASQCLMQQKHHVRRRPSSAEEPSSNADNTEVVEADLETYTIPTEEIQGEHSVEVDDASAEEKKHKAQQNAQSFKSVQQTLASHEKQLTNSKAAFTVSKAALKSAKPKEAAQDNEVNEDHEEIEAEADTSHSDVIQDDSSNSGDKANAEAATTDAQDETQEGNSNSTSQESADVGSQHNLVHTSGEGTIPSGGSAHHRSQKSVAQVSAKKKHKVQKNKEVHAVHKAASKSGHKNVATAHSSSMANRSNVAKVNASLKANKSAKHVAPVLGNSSSQDPFAGTQSKHGTDGKDQHHATRITIVIDDATDNGDEGEENQRHSRKHPAEISVVHRHAKKPSSVQHKEKTRDGHQSISLADMPRSSSKVTHFLDSLPKPMLALARKMFKTEEAVAAVIETSKQIDVTYAGVKMSLWVNTEDDALKRLHEEGTWFSYDLETLNAVVDSPDDMLNMIDIGSSYGMVSIAAMKKHPDNLRIVAVEPVPQTFFYLNWNLYTNGIPMIDEAYWDANKHVPGVLVVKAATTDRSGDRLHICNYPWSSMNSKACDCKAGEDNCLTVPTVGVSDLVSMYDKQPIAMVKMDCEGCEFKSLPALAQPDISSRVHRLAGELHLPDANLEHLACKWERGRLVSKCELPKNARKDDWKKVQCDLKLSCGLSFLIDSESSF